ncbi:MAG: hypothetical protein WCG92_04235 [Hyphomicrobiales bacterium]
MIESSFFFFDVGDELLKVGRGKIRPCEQHRRLVRDQHHGHEVGAQIVQRALVKRYVDSVGGAADKYLIAVGLRPCDARGANHAAGPGDVLDDHLLTQDLSEPLAENAGENVGASSRREAHHDVHRPAGIDVRARLPRQRRQHGKARNNLQ